MALDRSFVDELRGTLHPDDVLTGAEACAPYECDALTAHRRVPDVVALPWDVAAVLATIRIAHRHGVPVVTRGAGTGLSGGALPVAGACLLVLTRLNRILELDPRRRIARVEPGVTNLAISNAAAPYGLHYAPDPSSQLVCTIGGNLAENAGGVHCLKYGTTGSNVLAARLVLSDGELVTLGSASGDAPGLPLLAMVCGSEGMLGLVVEVTVRLLPLPERTELVMAGFADTTSCATAVARIIAGGVIPAGLEMMDEPAIRAVEAFARCGYPSDAGAVLLCELDGPPADVEADLARVDHVLDLCGATIRRRAADADDRARMWRGRKAAFPAVGRITPDYFCMDGTIPRRRMPDVLRQIGELAAAHRLRVANVFHAGDGNLHPLIMFDAARPDELDRAERLGAAILETCVAAGGTVTGEHGVGVEKLGPMCAQFAAGELDVFHAVKRAFDPGGRLNPGKAVPTLARCADYGALRVHGGRLPFPDLPRF